MNWSVGGANPRPTSRKLNGSRSMWVGGPVANLCLKGPGYYKVMPAKRYRRKKGGSVNPTRLSFYPSHLTQIETRPEKLGTRRGMQNFAAQFSHQSEPPLLSIMSSETVKKRGRPKKVTTLEEEVIVIEQSPKSKPRKATPKKQTVKDTVEPTKRSLEPAQTVEDTSAPKSQTKRGANGKNSAKSRLANSDTAKPQPSAGSAILQQATAFANATEQTTLTNPRACGINGAGPVPTERPVEANEVALGATTTGSSHERTPPLASKEEETQLGAGQTLSSKVIQKVTDTVPPQSTVTLASEEDPACLVQESQQRIADAMNGGVMSPSPSGGHGKSRASISNATATSSSPKSELSPAPKPITASKANPRLPTSFPPPPAPPPPPRPTQLPYHELKKNPEFKALSRKYTSLLIAIPIALFTSYVLYGRCKYDVFR
jgi:hypothetical protein